MSGSSEFGFFYLLAKGLIDIVKPNPENTAISFIVGVIIAVIYNYRSTIHEVITSIFQYGIRFLTKLKLSLFGIKIFDFEFQFDIFKQTYVGLV